MLGEIILAVEPIAHRGARMMVTIMATANIWLLRRAAAGLEKEHIKGLNQLNGTEVHILHL